MQIYKPPFTELYEVLNQEKFEYGTLGGTAWVNMFEVSEYGIYKDTVCQKIIFRHLNDYNSTIMPDIPKNPFD